MKENISDSLDLFTSETSNNTRDIRNIKQRHHNASYDKSRVPGLRGSVWRCTPKSMFNYMVLLSHIRIKNTASIKLFLITFLTENIPLTRQPL